MQRSTIQLRPEIDNQPSPDISGTPIDPTLLAHLTTVNEDLQKAVGKSQSAILTMERLLSNTVEVGSANHQDYIIERYKDYISELSTENDFFDNAGGQNYSAIFQQLDDETAKAKFRLLIYIAILKQMDEDHRQKFMMMLHDRLESWGVLSWKTAARGTVKSWFGGVVAGGLSAMFSGPVAPFYIAAMGVIHVGYQVGHRLEVKARCNALLQIFAEHFPEESKACDEKRAQQKQRSSWFGSFFKAKKTAEDEPLLTADNNLELDDRNTLRTSK